MITSLSTVAVALTVAGVAAAAPAGAATGNGPIPAGVGYLASPAAVRTVRVSLRVPTLHCATSSPKRAVRLGIFATSSSKAQPRPTGASLVVRASCERGRSQYATVYRNGTDAETGRTSAGDLVRLTLSATSYEVDDLTDGSADGGGSASPGGGPKLGDDVLVGDRIVGTTPHDLTTTFLHPTVNHTDLSKVAHHRQGRTAQVQVGSLTEHGAFQVTIG